MQEARGVRFVKTVCRGPPRSLNAAPEGKVGMVGAEELDLCSDRDWVLPKSGMDCMLTKGSLGPNTYCK